MYSFRGMGEMTVDVGGKSITVDANGNWVPSWFCRYLGFCLPPSASELSQANDLANLGPAASAATVATLQTQWAMTDAQQCAAYPEQCAAAQNPLGSALESGVQPFVDLSSAAGRAATAALDVGTGTLSLFSNPWLLAGGAAAFVALLIYMGGRR